MDTLFKEVVMADPNAAEVVPTLENVDFNKIYVYKNNFPDFGVFEEEKFKLNEAHINELCKEMVEGRWVGNPQITVDINTLNIIFHNHTYFATKKARMEGFDKPLEVRYSVAPSDKVGRMKMLIIDEHIRKWQPMEALKALMNNDEANPNSYALVYKYCMGHPYLKGNGKKVNLSYALITLFGESKPFMKAIKRAEFNLRNTKADFDNYDILDKFLEIKKAMGLEKINGPWIETFLRVWYKFYKRPENYTYLNCGGWDNFVANVPKVVTSMGGFVTSQDPDYVEKFLKNILNVTKGNKTLKEIRSDFNKKEVA